MKTVIFDIDGTLADCSHRQHHVRKKPPDWDAFFAGVKDDAPYQAVVDMANELFMVYDVVLVSGRPERTRTDTVAWLGQHGLADLPLYMRPDDDHRPDHEVKLDILRRLQAEGHDVKFAVDDRPQVVAMWRREGVLCLQCRDWDEDPKPEKPGHLVLMVGPSGSGKSYWLRWNNPSDFTLDTDSVVSSDQLRRNLCGDHRDQSKNDQVFRALHDIVGTRLRHGLTTAVDATNIRRADRLACVALADGGPVHYVVVNRPMAEKLEHRGWRPAELLERHEQTFRSQLKDILSGDGLPNVTVHNYIRE